MQHSKARLFLEGITNSGEFFMEALARTVEYLATFATIYLILEVGIVSLQAFPVPHNIALGIILSSPELVMIGAYSMATREIKQGNKAGYALLVSVGVLLLLTFLTVFDLMVWHFDQNGVNILMAFRFIASILYAFTRGVTTQKYHGHATPPALQIIDQWAFVGWAAQMQQQMEQAIVTLQTDLQTNFAQQLTDLSSTQKVTIAEISGSQKQALDLFRIEQQRLLGKVQDIENSVPEINYEVLFQAVAARLVPDFQAKFQAVEEELFRQKTLVGEVQIQAKMLPEKAEFRQKIQAKSPDTEPMKRVPKSPAKQAEQYDDKIIRLVPANASREELKAEAIRLHEEEGWSTYKVGEKLGKSAKTIQSWFSKDKDQAEERSEEQQEQAN